MSNGNDDTPTPVDDVVLKQRLLHQLQGLERRGAQPYSPMTMDHSVEEMKYRLQQYWNQMEQRKGRPPSGRTAEEEAMVQDFMGLFGDAVVNALRHQRQF